MEGLIEPYYSKAGNGRLPYPLAMLLRLSYLQHWHDSSNPGMEKACYNRTAMRRFARCALDRGGIPDESTLIQCRHPLKEHRLTAAIFTEVKADLDEQGLMRRQGTLVDATLIDAPSSTKNQARRRDPEMHQTRKGNPWDFGMKAPIGVDQASGRVHSLVGTATNVSELSPAHRLLHGDEAQVFADAGDTGIRKREEIKSGKALWHVAISRGRRKRIKEFGGALAAANEAAEKHKARVRALVEPPFRGLTCQFGYRKTRYPGLARNIAHRYASFALRNRYLARRKLLAGSGIRAPGFRFRSEQPGPGSSERRDQRRSVLSFVTIFTFGQHQAAFF